MNRYLITGIVTTILWETLSCQAWTQPPSCIAKSLPEVSNSLNSFRKREVIVIGKIPEHPYVVIVPGNSYKLLNSVRSYVADAFIAQHKLGAYIYAGGSSYREKAECLSHLLKSRGLDARVVYFPKKN
ncbi:hypothetical protein ACSQ6I_16145 [Anabaena sp. WFMT]|uniref:hypothetical protein n=1 Tax=Anabaena sp. WFMT TaxID=3449730 RepID=UPI003F25B189